MSYSDEDRESKNLETQEQKSQWFLGSAILGIFLGAAAGMFLVYSAQVNIKYEQKEQEVKARCCSCTQTELGECGR